MTISLLFIRPLESSSLTLSSCSGVRKSSLQLACFGCVRLAWVIELLLCASVSLAHPPGTAALAWDPITQSEVVGYRLHYGNVSGNYTGMIDVGNVTEVTISNLTSGSAWFFVVTACDAVGVESLPSNEIAFTDPLAPFPALINSLSWEDLGLRMDVAAPAPIAGPVGAFSVHYVGMFSVYYSDDLVTWNWLKDLALSPGSDWAIDPDAAFVGRRFYRLSF